MSEFRVQIAPPPPKLAFLYDSTELAKYEYIILKGGRGGGKTETIGQSFILNSFNDPADVLCLREIQNSIDDSVKKVLEEWIIEMDLEQYFRILKTEIVNKESGARFIFRGMRGSAESSSIKSLKGVKYVWYEEAQNCSASSLDVLLPTIRIDGRRFIFSMNPDTEDDVVPKVIGAMARTKIVHINYYDNPHCPQVLIDQANECKILFPDKYKHIWLGEPISDNDRRTVLPIDSLKMCVDAHKKLGNDSGHSYAGLDLASGELKTNDKNALSVVRGSVVLHSEEWRSGDLTAVASRTNSIINEYNAIRLYFDAVGVGGFADKHIRKMNPSYSVEAFMGQNKPLGNKRTYMRTHGGKIINENVFKNLKSQMWWNLRLRMENTVRLMHGFSSNRPEYYLSFSSKIEDIDGLLRELAQATYSEDASGKILIDKCPGDYKVVVGGKSTKMRSPNRADSICFAFLRSCKYGLKSNR